MNKRVNYAGIMLDHPVMAASAGTTRDMAHCLMCEDAGFSAVVLKSVQEETLMRHNPFPRFKVLRSGIKGYESCTFYSYEQAYEGGIDAYAETVRRTKERLSIPVIASINCLTPEAWPAYAIACMQAGADALEIVPSCPSGKLIRDSSNDIHTIAIEAMKAVRRAVTIPVVPKMTGQVADVLRTAMALDAAGADGLTMINRSTGIDIDIDTQAPILHGGFAGHGGSWALNTTLRWVLSARPLVKATISATGGVMTGADVIKCLLAGAQTAQVCAAIYLKGYDYVKQIIGEIDAYMEGKGIENLADIVGAAGKKLKKMEEYDRVTRYYAVCDRAKCTGCRVCEKVCIYEALHFAEGKPVIDTERCDGCGLCASVCRNGSIQMMVKE